MAGSEEELREALEGVLKLYDIELEEEADSEEEEGYADYSEIINKTQERLDYLSEKAETIYMRTGMSEEELEAYAANQSNFSKDEWEALQKVKEACEKYKKEARTRIGEEHLEKQPKKARKKQTHRFAKKKHWIPS